MKERTQRMDVGLSSSSFCSSYFSQRTCVHVCVCMIPGGRLLMSEMSGRDGEIAQTSTLSQCILYCNCLSVF